MSRIDFQKYDDGVKGIIEVNSPEGVIKITTPELKETLQRIQAINILRKAKKNVSSLVKGEKALEALTQKILGEIEVLSHEVAQ